MQQIVQPKMIGIDKHIKKTENRLKKLQYVLKDKYEEKVSARNIMGHNIIRHRSRSKTKNSQR